MVVFMFMGVIVLVIVFLAVRVRVCVMFGMRLRRIQRVHESRLILRTLLVLNCTATAT